MARLIGFGTGLLLLLGVACGGSDDSGPSQGATGTGAGGTGASSAGGSSTTGGASGVGSKGSVGGSSSSGGEGGSGNGTTVDGFTGRAAAAVCDALLRCCDQQDVADYFAPYLADDNLSAFATELPPAKSFASATECTGVLAKLMDVVPFGDWVAAAKTGAVEFVPQAADACIANLATASCGAEVEAALFDDGCFAFHAPAGPEQRSMFQRSSAVGAPCSPIKDGVGARFYGTCDPNVAFCCYANPKSSTSTCAYPFEADGSPRSGTCKAVSAAGGNCSLGLASVQLCKTGDDCGVDDECVAASHAPLAVGDECYVSFAMTGVCQNSYCNVLGDGKCKALKDDGLACALGEECKSGSCSTVCSPSSYCTGS